jgi:hypothetical protein
MPVKSWSIGDLLTAGDMNAWTVPIAVIKPSDTARTTTTALADDPDLIVPVAANAIYHINGVVFYDGPLGSGLKWAFSVPSGTTGQYWDIRAPSGGGLDANIAQNWTDTADTTTTGAGTILAVPFIGLLDTAGTAGNLTFRWAQNTGTGTDHVKAQSYFTAQRIG